MKSWNYVNIDEDKDSKYGRYDHMLMDFDQYKVRATESILLAGERELFRQTEHMFGYYILEGEILVQGQLYGKETFLRFESGHSFQAEVKKHLHVVYVETKKALKEGADGSPVILVESQLPYNRPYVDKNCCSKYFMNVKEHGAKVQTSTYTRGATTPWHTHSMAHGFMVLEGLLDYWVEEEYQLMGHGDFIVVPALLPNKHCPVEGSAYTKYFFIADDEFDFLVDGMPYKPF